MAATKLRSPTPSSKRWVAKVTTESTHPHEGLFTKSASTIARTLASKKVSPKGRISGLRMLTYSINRAGKGLSVDRQSELEKAKMLLSKRLQRHRGKNQTKKSRDTHEPKRRGKSPNT